MPTPASTGRMRRPEGRAERRAEVVEILAEGLVALILAGREQRDRDGAAAGGPPAAQGARATQTHSRI